MASLSGNSLVDSGRSSDKYNSLTLHIAGNYNYSGIIEFLVINRVFSEESAVSDTELFCALNNSGQSAKKAIRWLKKRKLCLIPKERRFYENGKNHVCYYLSEKGQEIGVELLDYMQTEEYVSLVCVNAPDAYLNQNGKDNTFSLQSSKIAADRNFKDKKTTESSDCDNTVAAYADSPQNQHSYSEKKDIQKCDEVSESQQAGSDSVCNLHELDSDCLRIFRCLIKNDSFSNEKAYPFTKIASELEMAHSDLDELLEKNKSCFGLVNNRPGTYKNLVTHVYLPEWIIEELIALQAPEEDYEPEDHDYSEGSTEFGENAEEEFFEVVVASDEPENTSADYYSEETLTGPDGIIWDDAQRYVINYPPDQRLVVDAGPGNGKTEVALSRVVHLINNCKLNASKIWILSFSNAAVDEIKKRIENRDEAYLVNVTTLDSYAWQIQKRSGKENKVFGGSYEDSIEKATEEINFNINIQGWLSEADHIIIDEAQDIVGLRANFVENILSEIREDCGVTVLGDQAQAIYGWTLDTNNHVYQEDRRSLLKRIMDGKYGEFGECHLGTVHRTDDDNLKHIFSEIRDIVLNDDDPDEKREILVRNISENAHEKDLTIGDLDSISGNHSCFVLYRYRTGVYQAVEEYGKPCRIRMGKLPKCIHPWVGRCFSEYDKEIIKKSDFVKLWQEKIGGKCKNIEGPDKAWELLVDYAGKTEDKVNMYDLRELLARNKIPGEFYNPWIGNSGPIFGTIHAAKGKEADDVYLTIPSKSKKDDYDRDEANRVIYVGATRAKKHLMIMNNDYKTISLTKEKKYKNKLNRNFKSIKSTQRGKYDFYIEIGLENDIDELSVAEKSMYRNEGKEHLLDLQNRLWEIHSHDNIITCDLVRTGDNSDDRIYYRIFSKNQKNREFGRIQVKIASDKGVSTLFGQDLWKLRIKVKGYNERTNFLLPDVISDVKIFGVRTIVLPKDSPKLRKIQSPFNKSGFMLAPVVLGFPRINFPEKI